ncbi:MAG TPA: cupin domain-containing protein [Candidatus Limnocylindrales bacterium]|nr:cupin domain-containing protein [Candidatus Limnocylindrales bacterium]
MTFVDTKKLEVIERLPGWFGRYFHSPNMTFAYYDFVKGASIHEHFHPEEEVWQVIEGELEVTVDGVAQVSRAGTATIVLPNVPHSIKALTDGRAIIVDYPGRPEMEKGKEKMEKGVRPNGGGRRSKLRRREISSDERLVAKAVASYRTPKWPCRRATRERGGRSPIRLGFFADSFEERSLR